MPTFRKSERLNSRKLIEDLVETGNFLNCFPLHVKWKVSEKGSAAQAAFTVPKRNFKRAVDRNKLKRRMREAYRKNKATISLFGGLTILFVYTGREQEEYKLIERAVITSLEKIQKRLAPQ